MSVLRKALLMLEKHPLCDHCLGRQFALLGHGIENDERGRAIKTVLTLNAHAASSSESSKGVKILKTLAAEGYSKTAQEVLCGMRKGISKKDASQVCFLCENKLDTIGTLTAKAIPLLNGYEFKTFLVGTELPLNAEEREDEFKAEFEVSHGEDMRNEFGRLIGKRVAVTTGKDVDFLKPEIVLLVNPFAETARLQINPLFVAGRYRKLARGIPQSKWFCSNCHGKGCKKCNWTGKMYPESVEEIIAKPFLEATGGMQSSFHASGREDIDARMLGTGRPFVIEITKPKKRFPDLDKMRDAVNLLGKGKVKVANLQFADKDTVRELKKGESKQKEYRVLMEFEDKIKPKDLRSLEKKLANTMISQRTPLRVSHRRADLTREKYIYEVNIKKLTPKKAEMKLRCQGGLYVKELVTGDEGRTTPSVSEILNNKATPMRLDVLNIIMGD